MKKGTKIAPKAKRIKLDSTAALINRELSWLSFARRVLAQVEDPKLPLLERIKFAGIMGMLHDERAAKQGGSAHAAQFGRPAVPLPYSAHRGRVWLFLSCA